MHSASDNIQTEHGRQTKWKLIHTVALTLLWPQYYTKATEKSHMVWPPSTSPLEVLHLPLYHISLYSPPVINHSVHTNVHSYNHVINFGGSNCFGLVIKVQGELEGNTAVSREWEKLINILTIYETSFHTPCTENNF